LVLVGEHNSVSYEVADFTNGGVSTGGEKDNMVSKQTCKLDVEKNSILVKPRVSGDGRDGLRPRKQP